MEPSLRELIHISRTLGSNQHLVWKGGGNISIKTDDGGMFIKASGSELGRMTAVKGWRKVDIAEVIKLLNRLARSKTTPAKISEGLMNCCCDGLRSSSMPSIETFFHALLGRCVVHLHPVYLLPYLCSRGGQHLLRAVLAEHYDFQWIAFRGLGVVTAGQIQHLLLKRRTDKTSTAVLMLSNHGLIVSCNTARQAIQMVGHIIRLCRKNLPGLKPACLPQRKQLPKTSAKIAECLSKESASMIVKPVPENRMRTSNGVLPERRWFEGTITPEEITYLAGGIVWIDKPDIKVIHKAITRHRKKTGQIPMAFYVDKQGLIIAADKTQMSVMKTVFGFYLQIRGNAIMMEGLKPLPARYLTPESMI
ncbi:MAG: class II aldolase/adducin family protein [Sedimentisphaerales bacterium]|nr:class II aldolase/adducin family protein [Sedimentisphaerales bacterium]